MRFLPYSLVGIRILFSCSCMATAKEPPTPIEIGERTTLHSETLKKDMILSIHVPDRTRQSKDTWPVLITFQTDFLHVAATVRQLYTSSLIPEMAVVGIDNYEYGYLSPTKLPWRKGSGQANLFIQFIQNELIPSMKANYNVNDYSLVFSNSWGAMFGVYAILSQPDVFDAAIASIPWLPYDRSEQYILKNTKAWLDGHSYKHFMYLALDNEVEIHDDVEAFVQILNDSKKPGLHVELVRWPEEDHSSAPYRAIYWGLRTLYQDWSRFPKEVLEGSINDVIQHEKKLEKTFGYPLRMSPFAYLLAANDLLNAKAYQKTEELLSLGKESHPKDIMIHATLGRAYDQQKKVDLAKAAYEQALQLAEAQNHRHQTWLKDKVEALSKEDKAPQ